MTATSSGVVIVGGGIVGIAAAYYLAKAGLPGIVVERDAIGSHASGFAYGGVGPLSGPGIPRAPGVRRAHRLTPVHILFLLFPPLL